MYNNYRYRYRKFVLCLIKNRAATVMANVIHKQGSLSFPVLHLKVELQLFQQVFLAKFLAVILVISFISLAYCLRCFMQSLNRLQSCCLVISFCVSSLLNKLSD